MNFNLDNALDVLRRTPEVLSAMLTDISEEWTTKNEGPDTWSVFDIVGHLVHGEKTDWVPRMEIILACDGDHQFQPFDRFAQFRESQGKTLHDLLTEFKDLRQRSIDILLSKRLQESDLERKGIHPAFGEVTLRQLLSTWVVHDLNHLAQISRVMAFQYKEAVGPWIEYLGVLKRGR